MALLPISSVETFHCIKGYDMGKVFKSVGKAIGNMVEGAVGTVTSVASGDFKGAVGNWEKLATFGTVDTTGEGKGVLANSKTFQTQENILEEEMEKIGDSSAAMLEQEKKITRKQRANLFSTSGGAVGEQVGYTGSQNRASLFGN